MASSVSDTIRIVYTIQTSYPLIEDMKNNNFRLLRWGVQSVLAGVDNVKIGYVTRKNMNVLYELIE